MRAANLNIGGKAETMAKLWMGAGWVLALALAGCMEKTAPVAHCADPVRGCRLEWNGKTADVRFLSVPGALKPFGLQVAAPSAHAVSAVFAMRDMDMGESRYRLVLGNDKLWRADVTLPACVAGRADWVMALEVDGTRVEMPFATGE